MKIYAAGAIRGDISYREFYHLTIRILKEFGHSPLTEMDIKDSLTYNDSDIFSRDINWLSDSKIMIAEISAPSLGVGFEIAYYLYQLNRPVLAIYHEKAKKPSAMILGCDSPLLTKQSYKDEEELRNIISDYLQFH